MQCHGKVISQSQGRHIGTDASKSDVDAMALLYFKSIVGLFEGNIENSEYLTKYVCSNKMRRGIAYWDANK